MQKIDISELLDIAEYEKVRTDQRSEIMAHKALRRVQLGPHISMTFEDRETIKFQIHEMMRAERMVQDENIQSEIDVYNTLIPGDSELSATLFIEITAEEDIKARLREFIGLTDGDNLWLEVGELHSYAQFEEGRSEDDKISSVHYIRFPISAEMNQELAAGDLPVRFGIEHGSYRYSAELSEPGRSSLVADLA